MFEYHNRINRKEQIVGWFGTTFPGGGSWIVDNSSLVHDFYSNECATPIHLVVDTTLAGSTMGLRAFMSRPMVVGEHALANMFDELRVELVLSEGEATCLFHMVNGQDQPWQDSLIISRIPDERGAAADAMDSLVFNLDRVIAYVEAVLDGRTAASASTGMALADALNSLKLISPEDFQTILQGRLQDLLMISHITTLTESQLNLAEKLNSLL
jgi:translation initiation factor 3 subunit F